MRSTMRLKTLVVAAIATAVTYAAATQAQSPSPARIVDAATEALGGKTRILALRTLIIIGYGQRAQLNGGENVGPEPFAPEKLTNLSNVVRQIDLQNSRMGLAQTATQDFVFAFELTMRGTRTNVRLDGNIAYDVLADNRTQRVGDAAVRTRRLDMLNNPISLVRAALDPAAKLSNVRPDRATNAQLLDLVTANGDAVTVAFDADTNRPAWVSWVQPNNTLGDVTVRTYFTGYMPIDGIQMPFGYTSIMDWRNTMLWRFFVDAVKIDAPIDELAAPEEARGPAPAPAAPNIQVENVAKGVWYLRGQGHSTAFEFADHITLYEVYGSEANARAIIEKARTLVPGKPVSEVIVSHHHFDHTGGLRAAVAEGLTIITQRANVPLFREMASRPARRFPDALGRNPRPIRIVPVDETLVLKDAAMEVQIYRPRNNSHMPNALIAYAPSAKSISQGDMVDENWDLVYWGNSYPETVAFYQLDVERDLAVHGKSNTYQDAIGHLRRQANNAKAFCQKAAEARFSIPGCPLTNGTF